MKNKYKYAKVEDFRSALLSIYDSLKLADNDSLDLTEESLTEIMFRKMKAYNIDLNKELGFTHLKPVKKNNTPKEDEEKYTPCIHYISCPCPKCTATY